MKNTWKGMVLGALTGAGIGLVLDIAQRLGDRAGTAAEHTAHAVRERAAHLAEVGAAAASDVAERIEKADLPGRAHDLVESGKAAAANVAQRIDKADLPGRGRDLAARVANAAPGGDK